PDLPTALTSTLDQENIILVKMRADSTALGRIAHHDIINPPVWNEAKRFNEGSNAWHIMIHSLNQQGPLLVTKLAKTFFTERAMLYGPPAVCGRLRYQPRFHALFTGQASQIVWLQWIAPCRPGIFDQQRLFLPIVT